MTKRIFISYRRDDTRSDAARLRDALASKIGKKNVFLDIDSLKPGELFAPEIRRVIGECDVVLAVVGSQWLEQFLARTISGKTDLVYVEIATALALGKRVVPVLIDDARIPEAAQLPSDLHQLLDAQAFRIRHESFGRDVDALIDGIGLSSKTKNAAILKKAIWGSVSAFMLALTYTLTQHLSPTSNPVVLVIDRTSTISLGRITCEHAKDDLNTQQKIAASFSIPCDDTRSCKDVLEILKICQSDNTAGAQYFQDEIERELSISPECSGISVTDVDITEPRTVWSRPELQQRDRSELFVAYDPRNRDTAKWVVVLNPGITSPRLSGIGTPKIIAESACNIAKKRGAKLNN